MKVEAAATNIKQELDLNPTVQRYEGMASIQDDRQAQIDSLTEEKHTIIKELMAVKTESQNVFFNFKKSEEALKSVTLQAALTQGKLEDIRHENADLRNNLEISQLKESNLAKECHAVQNKLTVLRRENSDLRNNLKISQLKESDLAKECQSAQEKDKKGQETISNLISKNKNLAAQIKQLKSGHGLQRDDRDKKLSTKDGNIFDVEKIMRHRIRNGKISYFVQWENFSSDQNTWEPEQNLYGTDILTIYKKKNNLV